MKYKLYNHADNNTDDVIYSVLKNRGIKDPNRYLHIDYHDEINYNNLDNIIEAAENFSFHFDKKDKMAVLVDEDVDGFTSAAEMYGYVKKLDADYPINYILHKRAKAHGLSAKDNDAIDIPDGTKLLIIPDAGSNDTEECKKLHEKGIDILILDHHIQDVENPYAIIVNNQNSAKYTNKDLSGAGVTYKFLEALDEELWVEFSGDFLDLCALGNIGDMMDIRSYETKYLISSGLANIHNKQFEALIKSQDYSMNGMCTIHNVQWYIVPIINGMIRNGSVEEKELLFRGFIEDYEEFEYVKRARKDNPSETIMETIYDRAARLCKNAKSRQDKLIDKSAQIMSEKICDLSDDDKIIIVDSTNDVDNSMTGIVAMRLAQKFNKPCILLNMTTLKEDGKKITVYGGSGRNINHSPIDDLKEVVSSIGVFDFAQGHENAFGIQLRKDKVDEAREALNKKLKDVEYQDLYLVDFILDSSDVTTDFVMDSDKLKNIIGQKIDETLCAIKDVSVKIMDIDVFGTNKDTLAFNLNGVKYIMFKAKDSKLMEHINNSFDGEETICFDTIIGKPVMNEYKGIRTPQILIEDYTIDDIIDAPDESDSSDEDLWGE